jgi:hypothetical protein
VRKDVDVSRNCKVIATCFAGGREIREETTILGDPPGPFEHSQNFSTPEKVLELVAYNYELERKVDPGVESDTIIVNNDVGWEKGNKYLESIRNTKIFSGQLVVINRENYGRSFGGYNRAYEIFRRQYEYWTFTEDDIMVIGDKYFKICIETFNRKQKTGFVAIQGLSHSIGLHAHGGVGTTRVDVLDTVYSKFGKLPHCERNQSQAYDDIILHGEVAFTNSIMNFGYELVNVKTARSLYSYAYDHMRGITPYDPRRSVSVRIRAVIKRLTPPVLLDWHRANKK